MWGHPVPVLGAISPFLEPFRGRLSPNIDNVFEKLTLRYPHEGPWVARLSAAEGRGTRDKDGVERLRRMLRAAQVRPSLYPVCVWVCGCVGVWVCGCVCVCVCVWFIEP